MTIPPLETITLNGNMPFAHSMLLTCSMQEMVKHICDLDNELDAIMESQPVLSACEHIEALTFNIIDHDYMLETLLTRPIESDA